MIRSFTNSGEIPRIYWWRTSNGEEVDFIVERGAKLYPIEVKITSRFNRGLVKNLVSFSSLFPDETEKCRLVNLSESVYHFTNHIKICPFVELVKILP